MSWKDLVGEPPLCEGGRLASIVFCCDPRKVNCPILDYALKMLGISKEDFVRVMEENRIEVPNIDGTCFGNLAFCPSLEKASGDRDEALRRLGWTVTRFLRYKYSLLQKLVPREKMSQVFNTRVLNQFAFSLLDLETKKEYHGFAVGNLDLRMLRLTEVFREHDLRDREIDSVLSNLEFVGVRIPSELVSKLDELVQKGIIKSRSDGIRRALILYLKSLEFVKQENSV